MGNCAINGRVLLFGALNNSENLMAGFSLISIEISEIALRVSVTLNTIFNKEFRIFIDSFLYDKIFNQP